MKTNHEKHHTRNIIITASALPGEAGYAMNHLPEKERARITIILCQPTASSSGSLVCARC
jgi:hypothetical protein